MEKLRRRAARMVRRIYNHANLPLPVVRFLRRVAHVIHPHVLRCRVCGAEFVATSALSLAHADRAYDHYVTAHEGWQR